MNIKLIKTEQDYKEALELIDQLMSSDPDANSSEGQQLEILATLVQNYEENIFGKSVPDPIDALLFRMEQQNLSPEDLVPYIGSRSKVSEVLSRKRPLSVNMMRALHDGLGIPANVLLNQQKASETTDLNFEKFPIKEMLKRGYLIGKVNTDISNLADQFKEFFSPINSSEDVSALLSRTSYIRSPRPMNQNALLAWVARVANKAKEQKVETNFEAGSINKAFLQKIADLSDEPDAIHKVFDLLKTVGILVIVEPHMPQTYLDGAVIMIPGKNPIIGITVRHDRLDNFWFTLLHELSHIALHYGKGTSLFYDDIESVDFTDPREKEADELALEAMIPEESWQNSPASMLPSPDAAKLLARELSIHPSIVAGKMRYERKQYHLLISLVGKGEVRKLFPEVNWSK